MSTITHIITSAKKDLKTAKNKLTELLQFDKNCECTIRLDTEKETINKSINEIDKLLNILEGLVKT